jgi:hypothetical protein
MSDRLPLFVGRGIASGCVTGAAILGMLLGMGRRSGTVWRPFNAAAHTLLGARADGVWGFQPDVTLTGVGVVFFMSVVAGLVTASLATSRRTLTGYAAAGGVALFGYLLHLHVIARPSGGLASLLSLGELRALYVIAALTLAIGMRFAFLPRGDSAQA